eukprot:CAMPEP_0174255618 /NCGR_PEP_ID=MMETSP0439-20130205/4935_1 /TAXON_ID=0 /ORGANISM="Stereomyxa ramosa, Strain Chinc5" /LENGTH=236 /DNA_ID=CAMNT_0015337869 /DNA_START=227 /DNA_END=937 /DNA_ORIENTATION=-
MSKSKSKRYFRKFIKEWNRGSLSSMYYGGMITPTSSATKYKWKFTENKEYDKQFTGSVRDEVVKATNYGPSLLPDEPKEPTITYQPKHHQEQPKMQKEDELDREERRRYEYLMQKKKNSEFRSLQKSVMEELVPKADPGSFQARAEKRRQKSSYTRKGDDSPDHLANWDIYAPSDDIKTTIAQTKERRERREAKKGEERRERLEALKQKEQATMQVFKDMIASGSFPNLLPKSQNI